MLDVIFYIRPNGERTVATIVNISKDDEEYLKSINAKISMEEVGHNQYAIYADIGIVNEDGEPDECLEISRGRTCEETFEELVKQCKYVLGKESQK